MTILPGRRRTARAGSPPPQTKGNEFMLRRIGAALALVGLLAVGSAAPVAQAAGGNWLPPSWVTVSVGTMAQARAALMGQAPGIEGGGGAADGEWILRKYPLSAADAAFSWRPSSPTPGSVQMYCRANPGGACGGWGTPTSSTSFIRSGSVYCADGYSSPNGYINSGWPSAAATCGAHGGMVRYVQESWSDAGHAVEGFEIVPNVAASGEYVTSVTCQKGTDLGSAHTVGVEGAWGGPAPAAPCPSGEFSIKVSVKFLQAGVDPVVVLSAFVSNTGAWRDMLDGGGSSGPVRAVDGSCGISSGGMWWSLSQTDCDTGDLEGVGQPPGSGDGEGDSDNPVIRAMQSGFSSVIKAIKSMADGVVSAVNSVRTAVNGVTSAVGKIGDDLNRMFLCGGNAGCDAEWEQLRQIGSEAGARTGAGAWVDLINRWTSVFTSWGTCPCRLPDVSVTSGPVAWHGSLLDFCSGWLRTLADLSKMMSRVVLGVMALGASVRFLSASLGYVGPLGDSVIRLRGGE